MMEHSPIPHARYPLIFPAGKLLTEKSIALCVIALGLFVLCGWMWDIDPLKRLLPGIVTMKANTAAAFALSGTCLYLHTLRNAAFPLKLARWASAILVLLIGLATLFEYSTGRDIGLDQLLFTEHTEAILTFHPGRMSNITALNFVLAGSALLLTEIRRMLAAQLVSFALMASTLIPLIGYLFGNLSLTHIGKATAIAAHTVVGFLLLSVGLLAATRKHGIMVIVQAKSLSLGLAGALLTLIFIFSAMSYNIGQKDKVNQWVADTYNTIIAMESFSSALGDFLQHSRGFLVTGNDTQLEGMKYSREDMLANLDTINLLTSQNTVQQSRLKTLDKLVTQRMELSESLVQMRISKDSKGIAAAMAEGAGDKMTRDIELVLDELVGGERELLDERQKLAKVSSTSSLFALGVLLTVSLLLLAWIFRTLQREITDRERAEREIENLAFYDPLTQLPNRRLLTYRLQQALALNARTGRQGALMFIDLDNFKTINDTQGHAVGDQLLVEAANRLQGCIRGGDTTARLGGDEFVVLIEDMDADEQAAAFQAETIGEKIRVALSQPYSIGEHEYHSSASIGVTLFSGSTKTIGEMLKCADVALYQAKADGRNTLRFFDPEMQAAITTHAALEADLRRAVSEQEQFVLYYQPQVDTAGRLTGAEALVRWQHPVRGMVSPAEFIPLAEESGLILPLGHWVLATACQQLAYWEGQPSTAHLTLAVNVSTKQFNLPTFVEEVLTLVNYFKVNPARLKLEITESLMMDNVDDIIAKMSVLQANGISFSMDDFGTGYSSLTYLKRLPLSQLKIDQSFVRDVLTDSNDAAIAKIIISLAHSMNLRVIAEGVETEMQREFLRLSGCHAFQGYLFGKPMPLRQFEATLAPPQDTTATTPVS